ncbi:diacylglycerol kinase family protein [Hahella sp. CR1]|uniref:diacylglycerol/lipid kinase family protein n=1 Tax=Hahella sp. CR1 TaxID=2992807 RepID=UPI002441F26B|nr:diacylglycerol kinase family protein [Hahella sp. CR1]MDG9668145.1 diacylglycerol kinase family protein [Hahella sp. CR1]
MQVAEIKRHNVPTVERKLVMLVNLGSGKGRSGDSMEQLESAPASVRDRILSTHSIRQGIGLQETIRRAAQEAKENQAVLVVVGGDGTINAALPHILEHRVTFAVVPGGTFNLFAKEHKLPENFAEALDIALNGVVKAIPLYQVNDILFAVNASLGLYPRIIQARESHQKRFGRFRWVAFLSGIWTCLTQARPQRMKLTSEGFSRAINTPLLFSTISRMQLELLNLQDEKAADDQGFVAIVLKAKERLQLMKLLGRMALGMPESPEYYEHIVCRELQIDSHRKSLRVVVDGEIRNVSTPVRMRALPSAALFVALPDPDKNVN